MILQQEKPVKIWGTATPGEQIMVEMQGNSRIRFFDVPEVCYMERIFSVMSGGKRACKGRKQDNNYIC